MKKKLISIITILVQILSLIVYVPMVHAQGLPDLIVTDISWQPANPQAGDKVLFGVTIKNVGDAPTPSGVVHGVGFHIDNDYTRFWWTDNFTGPLQPGEEKTLTVTGGMGGPDRNLPTWDAIGGRHTVWAFVDDYDPNPGDDITGRIKESNEDNNVFGKEILVTASSTGPRIVRIKSSWTGQYVYQAGDKLEYSYNIPAEDACSQWIIEEFEGSIRIKNRATYNYIHIQNYDSKKYVECGNIDDSWYSARWVLEDAGGSYRIKSVYKNTQYLNIEGNPGYVVLSEVYPEWDSAKWILEDVDITQNFTAPLPDLVIEDLYWEPANPQEGDDVLFKVKVKNIGEGAVQEGEQIAAGFNVDGKAPWFWTDLYTGGLAAGQSIVLPVIGGSEGKYWKAKSGIHTLYCNVDDYDPDPNDDKVGRVKESNDNNNSFHKRLPYIPKAQSKEEPLPLMCGAIYVGGKLNVAKDVYHNDTRAENKVMKIREKFSNLKNNNNVDALLFDELTKYKIEKVVIGTPNPANAKPSKFAMYWDENYLYAVVRVYDAAKRKDAPDPGQIWNNDSVEIYLDMDRNKEDSYTSDDFQYFFGWNYSQPMEFKHNAIQNVRFTQHDFDDGYGMLIEIPWTTLGVSVQKNMVFGFDIAIDDNYANQTRGCQYIWNSKDDQAWQYPNRFGDCQLVLSLGTPKQLPPPQKQQAQKPEAPPYQVPAGIGANVPWIELEAESASTNGDIIGPSYEVNDEANEASNRRFVRLDQIGEYVEFTAPSEVNSIVVRYSIPDSDDGKGIDATISLYVNGQFRQKLNLTSRYSWVYGAYPWSNDPSFGAPRYYFDEVRALIGQVNPGDKIRLQVDSGDDSPYYDIDLIDIENVAPPLAKPDNFLDIRDFGAIPNDGKDDTKAIYDAIFAAKQQGKGVWIPEGVFEKLEGPVVDNVYTGFSGTGYVKGFDVIGATEKLLITGIPSDGNYVMEIRYSNATTTNQTLSFMVNGRRYEVLLPSTGSWDSWQTTTIDVALNTGRNLLQIIHQYEDTGNVYLDYVKVNNTKFEAEDGWLTCPIYVDNVTIRGAGMWYSTISGPYSQFVLMGNNCKFYDFAIFGETNSRIDELDDNAFSGWGGMGSVLENIWVEHKKCGFWVGNSKYGRTDGLVIRNCRFRNLMADGVNLCDGTINSIIENCHARNTGDDAFAIWSATYNQNIWACENNIIRNNTIQQPWLAQGIALYGGSNNIVENNLIIDIPTSAGILISTTFPCIPFSGTSEVRNNSIVRAGEPSGKLGAIRIMCDQQDISGIVIKDIDLYDCTDVGIRFMGTKQANGIVFENVRINYTGSYGIYASGETKGRVIFKNVTIDNTALDKVMFETPNMTVEKLEGNNW